MSRLAFTTFAVAKRPFGTSELEGFLKLEPKVDLEAEKSPGFIDRARGIDVDDTKLSDSELNYGIWGPMVSPNFYDGGSNLETETRASTLSLWMNIEAVWNFAYHGLHRTALLQRHKWFRVPEWPSYAMWWVSDSHVPTWAEAAWRLEYLMAHGPTPVSFVFKYPFNNDSMPIFSHDFNHPPLRLKQASEDNNRADFHDGTKSCLRNFMPKE